jgi:hypothetical protein
VGGEPDQSAARNHTEANEAAGEISGRFAFWRGMSVES